MGWSCLVSLEAPSLSSNYDLHTHVYVWIGEPLYLNVNGPCHAGPATQAQVNQKRKTFWWVVKGSGPHVEKLEMRLENKWKKMPLMKKDGLDR